MAEESGAVVRVGMEWRSEGGVLRKGSGGSGSGGGAAAVVVEEEGASSSRRPVVLWLEGRRRRSWSGTVARRRKRNSSRDKRGEVVRDEDEEVRVEVAGVRVSRRLLLPGEGVKVWK